jgi:GntR family transcriptional regulator
MSVAAFLRSGPWLDETSGPRYARLRRRISEGIETGLLAPDAPLPPEREIATLTGLSRVTVRNAMQALVEQGLICQRQGSGSFVAPALPRTEPSLSRLTSFTEDMARRGLQPDSHWLERGLFIPSPEEVVTLGLSAGDMVARLSRLRRAGGQPMALEYASLPPDLLPDPQSVSLSLYEALTKLGHRPVRALQKLSALSLGADEAARLGVPAGHAGLKIERTSYLASGRIVEFTRSIYRGDVYDFVAELRLPQEQAEP